MYVELLSVLKGVSVMLDKAFKLDSIEAGKAKEAKVYVECAKTQLDEVIKGMTEPEEREPVDQPRRKGKKKKGDDEDLDAGAEQAKGELTEGTEEEI